MLTEFFARFIYFQPTRARTYKKSPERQRAEASLIPYIGRHRNFAGDRGGLYGKVVNL
jgi:hypothetical protein